MSKDFARIQPILKEWIKNNFLVVKYYNDLMYHAETSDEESKILWDMLPKKFQNTIMIQYEEEQKEIEKQERYNNIMWNCM